MVAGTIYKLMTRAEWEAAQGEGVYRGSAHDRRDGFIHLSTAGQRADTARKYFSGVGDLVLLAVNVEVLGSPPSPQPSPAGGEGVGRARCDSVPSPLAGEGQGEGAIPLRWEPSRGGDLFPHLYADLPLAAVKGTTALSLAADGTPVIPSDIEP